MDKLGQLAYSNPELLYLYKGVVATPPLQIVDDVLGSVKLKPTIEFRISRGYGSISNILAIVNEIPLAHWRVEAGLHLRQAMLLNGTLFNSEAWQGITISEIHQLERVDEALLRGN